LTPLKDLGCYELHKSTVFRPDAVELEQWHESMRPDIVVRRGDKELLVEIRVTHACTPEKLVLLAERQKPAIEIDLSRLPRHLEGVALEDQVLRLAPREWLWNPHLAKANAETQARLAEIRAKIDAETEAGITSKVRVLQQAAATPFRAWDGAQPHIDIVRQSGLGSLVGHNLPGDECFAVSQEAWQSMLVFSLLKSGWSSVWPTSVPSLLDWLDRQRLIKNAFLRGGVPHILPDWKAVWERIPELRPPLVVLNDYIDLLRREGVIRNDRTGLLEPSSDRLIPARARLAALGAENERIKDVRVIAIRVLDVVIPKDGAVSFGHQTRPTQERADGFDIDKWMTTFRPDWKGTPEVVARRGGEAYGRLVTRLNELAMLAKPTVSIPDGSNLGLPITAALAVRANEVAQRRRDREAVNLKWQEQAARQQAEARKQEAKKRLDRLTSMAYDCLTLDGHGWLHAPHPVLGGQSLVATEGWMTEDQYDALRQDLKQEDIRRQADRKSANAVELSRGALSREAVSLFGDAQAAVWMHSSHPKLGGKRPQDVCLTPDAGLFDADE